MDVLIRDLDPAYVKEIDRKAKEISRKLGRKFSRHDYIKMLIQNDIEIRLIELKEQKFDEAIDNLSIVLERQVNTLQNFIDSNNRVTQAIITGEDPYERGEGNG